MYFTLSQESDEEDEDEERAMRVVKICDFFLYHYSEIKQDRWVCSFFLFSLSALTDTI